jgi:ketosteroid isomerase-like protein
VANTTHPQARDVFAVIDAMDLTALGSLFIEDARLTFGNNPPMIGAEQIRSGTKQFFDTIAGLHHTIVNEWHVDGQTIVELMVAYDRKDGQQVMIPCVTIFHSGDDGRIDDYRVYFDVAPIYA